MSRVILVLCDALRDDVAAEEMGFLEGQVEGGLATRFHVRSALPSLSRPLYETLHTGLVPARHGVTSNLVQRRSQVPSVFSLARASGLTTAAAAYSWYCELYVRTPFQPAADKEVDDEGALIQHGRYYFRDEYPDPELFAQAAWLAARWRPDYLLVHPMGADEQGHRHGGWSSEYRNQVVLQDQLLALAVPPWREAGYTVLVTGDHGMNEHRNHNGTAASVRNVPLYVLPADGAGRGDTGLTVDQCSIAPTVCALLGLTPDAGMTSPVLDVGTA